MPSLVDKITAIAQALTAAELPHAFGGALALAYYATPRTTQDIDINIFVTIDQQDLVRASLAPLGIGGWPSRSTVERDGQYRARWEETPIDVFLNTLRLHEEMRRERRRVPFGSSEIWILAPEHLAICKAMFNRAKDWIDLAEMTLTGSVDLREVRSWLADHLEADDPRIIALDALLEPPAP